MSFASKKKKLPKKWKPTTTMFVPSKEDPGKYVLSKHHNLKFEYDPSEQNDRVETDDPNEPSLIQEIEAATKEDVDEEPADDQKFLESYKWIITAMIGMVSVVMGGFMLGFTRLKISDLTKDENDEKDDKDSNILIHYLSMLKGDESVVKNRHKYIAQILISLQNNATDSIVLNREQRFKNKIDREGQYLEMFDENKMTESPQLYEQKLSDKVTNVNWGNIDLSDFSIDDIEETEWNFSQYIDDIRNDDVRLQFLPPLDNIRYGQSKKCKLMWIYSKKRWYIFYAI